MSTDHPSRWRTAAVLAPLVLALAPGSVASSGTSASLADVELQVMIASSGDAETNAINAATDRFAEATGAVVEVIPAQDQWQQLTQGFAGGNPPDVFYVDPQHVVQFGRAGSLYPYGDQIEDLDDFSPALLEAYTIDDELYCVAKDGGALALVINTDAWAEAGLTEDDYPTTWEELTEVSTALTTGDQAGLVFEGSIHRVGAFMVQAGGWVLNDEQTEAIADSPENVEALTYLQDNLLAGNFQFAAQVEAAWGGEAFGTEKAAMTIEGAWIAGAMSNDFPDVNWIAVELPEGPAGPGTLSFSNCWGIAAASENQEAAVALVEHLLQPEEQQAFAEAFGPQPSRVSLTDWFIEQRPELEAMARGVEYSQGPVSAPGFESVMTDFFSQLEGLAAGSVSPEDVLQRLQETSEEALADQ